MVKPASAVVAGKDASNKHYEDQIAELKQQLASVKRRAAEALEVAQGQHAAKFNAFALEAVENEMDCKKQIEKQRKEIQALQEEVGTLRKQQAGPDGAAEKAQNAEKKDQEQKWSQQEYYDTVSRLEADKYQ